MRRWPCLSLLLLALGCGSPSTPPAEPAPPAPTPTASTPPTTTPESPAKNEGATAVLKEKDLAPFFNRLSGMAGHGAWSKENIQAAVTQMKGTPKGEIRSGDLHVDHGGRHVDVTMTVQREAEDAYRLTFTAPNPDLLRAIQALFPKA